MTNSTDYNRAAYLHLLKFLTNWLLSVRPMENMTILTIIINPKRCS